MWHCPLDCPTLAFVVQWLVLSPVYSLVHSTLHSRVWHCCKKKNSSICKSLWRTSARTWNFAFHSTRRGVRVVSPRRKFEVLLFSSPRRGVRVVSPRRELEISRFLSARRGVRVVSPRRELEILLFSSPRRGVGVVSPRRELVGAIQNSGFRVKPEFCSELWAQFYKLWVLSGPGTYFGSFHISFPKFLKDNSKVIQYDAGHQKIPQWLRSTKDQKVTSGGLDKCRWEQKKPLVRS